mgnify:CR=1 FL=1
MPQYQQPIMWILVAHILNRAAHANYFVWLLSNSNSRLINNPYIGASQNWIHSFDSWFSSSLWAISYTSVVDESSGSKFQPDPTFEVFTNFFFLLSKPFLVIVRRKRFQHGHFMKSLVYLLFFSEKMKMQFLTKSEKTWTVPSW